MFNNKRAPLLYWALGIAGAVVAAAGTGTWFFIMRGRNQREVRENAKRVVAHATKTRKAPTTHAKTTHAKTNHTKTNSAHHAHAR